MLKHYHRLLLGLLMLLALGLPSCGEPDERLVPTTEPTTEPGYETTIPDPKTLGETYVSDPNGLLQPATVAALNARLDSLDHSGRAHIDVVLVESIDEAVPKTAATTLFNKWKIGDPAKDNGLLLLLVMDQRRVEFETGYGLEADLPDITCYRIQQRYMVPELQAGRTDAAVQAGVAVLIRELAGAEAGSATGAGLVPKTDSASVEQRIDQMLGEEFVAEPKTDEQFAREDERAYQRESTGPFWSFWSAWGGWLTSVAGLGLGLWWALRAEDAGKKKRWLAGLGSGAYAMTLISLSLTSLLVLAYVLPLLAAHSYFLYLYQRTRPPEWQRLSRRRQYLRLRRTHRYLGFTAYLFPLVLAWYWSWHRRRLAHLRHDPYTCPDCGQPMRQLDDTAEKPHLTAGERAEETVESIDYDVWQCPQGHELQLAYANPASTVRQCPACHYQTLEYTGSWQAKAPTYTAEGQGWRTYRCKACPHQEKEQYTIARKSDDSSSSGGSYSSSSSSSGSGSSSSSGGSSGGGGAGSSW